MGKEAVIETDKGTIRLKLSDRECPKTVSNFEKLARQGFYDGLAFHRVIRNFMIQGGCPKGDGTGGPGYDTDCEIHPKLKHTKGALSMAHSGQCKHDPASGVKIKGRCTNGSQFFITHLPTPHLDGIHTVFGQVIEGQDVVDEIRQGDKIKSVTIEQVS